MNKDERIQELISKMDLLKFDIVNYIQRQPHTFIVNGKFIDHPSAIQMIKDFQSSGTFVVNRTPDEEVPIQDTDLRIDLDEIFEKIKQLRLLQDEYYGFMTDYKIVYPPSPYNK